MSELVLYDRSHLPGQAADVWEREVGGLADAYASDGVESREPVLIREEEFFDAEDHVIVLLKFWAAHPWSGPAVRCRALPVLVAPVPADGAACSRSFKNLA